MNFFKSIILKTEILNNHHKFEETNADLNIAFGIDANFARGMGVLIDSICTNNSDEKIVFHIFTDGINQNDTKRLKELTKYDQIIIKFYYIDVNAFKNLPTTLAWSYATYYRFIMGKVLYGKVDKVLYLDADILCIGSLKELKHIDMGNNIVLAISEKGTINVKRLALENGKYFNAGVLYIDINKWNDEKIAERAITMLNENPEKYTYLDQDVLNILLDGKTYFADTKWNYLYDMRKMNNQLPEGIVLIHFIGDKPWQCWSQHHFMVKYYNQYMEKSPWSDMPLTEPIHYKEKKRMAKSYANRGQYLQCFLWYCKYAIAKFKN